VQKDFAAYHDHYSTLLFLMPFPVDVQLLSTVNEFGVWFVKLEDMTHTLVNLMYNSN